MKVKIKALPKQTAQSGIQVENNAIKQISPNFHQILGEPHSNGGTDVQYAGQQVEMQNGEPISINNQGDLVAWGKLRVPGQKKTFERAAKDIAEEEVKVVKQADKSVQLINTSDPYNKFEALSFNSGIVLGNAAKIKQETLNTEREVLGDLQQSILDTAEAMGTKPENIVKMKNGGKIKVKIKGTPQMQFGGTVLPRWLTQAGEVMPLPTYQQAPMGAYVYPTPTPIEVVAPNASGTLAQRNNNPGNLRFNNQKGATKGDAGFARFNSYEEGYQALLNDLKAKQSGKTRTGLGPNSSILDLMNVYSPASDNNNPQQLARTLAQGFGVNTSAKIGDLDTKKLADLIAINEDAAYAASKGTTPSNIPSESQQETIIPRPNLATPPIRTTNDFITPTGMTQANIDRSNAIPGFNNGITSNADASILQDQIANRPQNSQQTQFQDVNRPATRNRFNYLSILPEIAAVFGRPDYVPGQQYTPTLFEPYRVSFQDQINQNQANFNQVAQLSQNNPAALASLAGQLYGQNQQVLGNEFRTNQQITNQVSNQNTELLNQAQLTNLQLVDQQAQKQAQARANTEAARQAALTSISQKVQQNQLLNNQLAQQDYQNRLIENFSGFRDTGNGQLQYQGPAATFNLNLTPDQVNTLTPEQQKQYTEMKKLQNQSLRAQNEQQRLQQQAQRIQKTNWYTQLFNRR